MGDREREGARKERSEKEGVEGREKEKEEREKVQPPFFFLPSISVYPVVLAAQLQARPVDPLRVSE